MLLEFSIAARFVKGNYIYETGSMSDILEQIVLERLKSVGRGGGDSRLIMFHKLLVPFEHNPSQVFHFPLDLLFQRFQTANV